MRLDYVDIFYSHRFDPDTPLEETMGALDTAVRQGKALYAGISSYSAQKTREAAAIMRGARDADPHPPAVVLDAEPLDRDRRPARRPRRVGHRLHRLLAARPGDALRPIPGAAIPKGSRASEKGSSLSPDLLNDDALGKIRALNEIAQRRGQTLAQMALAWTLRDPRVTSTLVGASSVVQLEQNLAALDKLDFSAEELAEIDEHASDSGINLWAESSAG